jgi:hypothetical protein
MWRTLPNFTVTVTPWCLSSSKLQEIFPVWERHGFHVTPAHYQPILDTQSFREDLWTRLTELVGVGTDKRISFLDRAIFAPTVSKL